MISKYRFEKIFRFLTFPPLFFLTILKLTRNKLLKKPIETDVMLNIKPLCRKYSIKPLGLIHVGAHVGQELGIYREMGFKNILCIEPNPPVFEKLKKNITNEMPNAKAVNCAVSNTNGETKLYVTSLSPSSSILPLKEHKRIYPSIVESGQITVQCRTLDKLLEEQQLDPSDFNFITIDIQGAELMAFQGSINTLKHIEGINVEVNYKELYEGGAMIEQIDEFLAKEGFKRVATLTAVHPSWGDAFYVKKKTNPSTKK
ncbi:MAG: FkbM family methyltransferase [Cyanobacteria bacterium P01_H01_bin.35]